MMLDLKIKATHEEAKFVWSTIARQGDSLILPKWMAWVNFMWGKNKMNLITYSIYLDTVKMKMNNP